MSLGVAMLEAGETPSLRAERDPNRRTDSRSDIYAGLLHVLME